MNTQLTDLADSLQKKVTNLPSVSNDMAKQAAEAIIQDLVLVTPVDVGTAVSNWQVSLNQPASTVIPAYVPSPKGKVVNGKWQHTVSPDLTREANASQVLETAITIIQAKQLGQDIFISNNLPYIESLNQGSSEQAPAGFSDRATVLAQSVIDKGLKLG